MIGRSVTCDSWNHPLTHPHPTSTPIEFQYILSTRLLNPCYRHLLSIQVTYAGKSFIKHFRAQSPTISPTGVCSSATDDDGKYTLWKRNLTGTMVCSGLNYLSIPEDGSTMDGLTAYVYDATMFLLQVGEQLIVHALCVGNPPAYHDVSRPLSHHPIILTSLPLHLIHFVL